jgi:hypothetical protein
MTKELADKYYPDVSKTEYGTVKEDVLLQEESTPKNTTNRYIDHPKKVGVKVLNPDYVPPKKAEYVDHPTKTGVKVRKEDIKESVQRLTKLLTPPEQDEDEDIETVLLTPEELEKAILTGESVDAKSIASFFLLRSFLK